jgi:hypothetical protein
MQIHTFSFYYELMNKFRKAGKNIQINNPSEKRPGSDIIPTSDSQEKESLPIDKSTRRALELSRKGIFACPQFIRLFNNYDEDIRIY